MIEDPDDDLKLTLAMICTFLVVILLGIVPVAFCFCCSLIKIQRAKNELLKEMAAYDDMVPPPPETVTVPPPPPTMNRAPYSGLPPPYARFGPGQALLPGPGSIAQPHPAAATEQQEPKSSEKL